MIVTVEPDATVPRVRIETTAAQVWRVQGSERTQVRGVVADGVIYDYECPQQTPVTYDDGLAVSETVELPDLGDWLIHLGTPELSQQVVIRTHPSWVSPNAQAVADIPGGATIVRTFPRQASRGDVRVNTYDEQDRAALQALLADGSILFLSSHADLGFGPAYVAVGTVDWARRFEWDGDQGRIITLPYVEVERPAFVQTTGGRIEDLTGTIGNLPGTIGSLGR